MGQDSFAQSPRSRYPFAERRTGRTGRTGLGRALIWVPSLLLALVLVAVLGPGLLNAMIAISLVNQPHFVRLTRASVMTERTSRSSGARPVTRAV